MTEEKSISSSELEQILRENASGPKKVSGDAASVEQHSIGDLIEADKYQFLLFFSDERPESPPGGRNRPGCASEKRRIGRDIPRDSKYHRPISGRRFFCRR